jgi:hypothetical protein
MESERFRKIADLEMQSRETKSAGVSYCRKIDFRVVANDGPPNRAAVLIGPLTPSLGP